MNVVVMIPAYNEETSIASVISKIPRNCEENVQVIVIDDGSADRTVEVAREAGADKIVSHGFNKGLGVAFRTGLETAVGMGADIIVNIDADGQFNPDDIPKLLQPIIENKADMVTCSRFLKEEWIPKMPGIKRFGNSFFTWVLNSLTKQKFTDTLCGFRAYSRETALRMNLMGSFTYTQEVFLDLAEKGMRISEVACKVRGEREHGKSKIVKNPFIYGINSLIIIITAFRDYQPLKFFGGIGFSVLTVGMIMGLFLFLDYIPKPLAWMTVFQSLLAIVVGFILLELALVADMNDRQRKISEEILYRLKKGNSLGKE